MLTDIQRAMLGDHEAAKRLTDAGVLVPCPMCGGNPVREAPNMHGKTTVTCTQCGLTTRWGRHYDVSLAWNTRAPILSESELKNYVEAVKKIDVTQKENWEHAIRNGLAVPTYGIKEAICLNTGKTYKSAAEAARALGTGTGVISKICLGDRGSFYGYKFKYTGHEKKPRKRKQLNQNDMADMLLSYSIKAREAKSKKELKKIIYELKEEMDLKKYDATEMEMLEGMEK